VAFGLFTSSITESQIIAAVLGTVTLFFILLIDQLKTLVSGFLLKVINQLSLYEHYSSLSRV